MKSKVVKILMMIVLFFFVAIGMLWSCAHETELQKELGIFPDYFEAYQHPKLLLDARKKCLKREVLNSRFCSVYLTEFVPSVLSLHRKKKDGSDSYLETCYSHDYSEVYQSCFEPGGYFYKKYKE